MKKLLLLLFICAAWLVGYGQYSPYGVTVAGGNGAGNGANQLSSPQMIYVDSLQNIYVADWGNSRIQKWAPGASSGVTVAYRDINIDRIDAYGVFVDKHENLFVTDYFGGRLFKFVPGDTIGIVIAGGYGSSLNSLNQFEPTGIFVDDSDNIYVADMNGSRVIKFAPGDSLGVVVERGINSLGIFVDSAKSVFVTDRYSVAKWAIGAYSNLVVAGGSTIPPIDAPNQLYDPTALYIDSAQNLFIADGENHRIQLWLAGSTQGITIAGGNGAGSGPTQLYGPTGLWLDKEGNLYVSDNQNNRVQKFWNKSIIITNQIDTVYQPRQRVSIGFNVTSNFFSGNIFTLQLSDKYGDFSNAIDLGSLVQIGNGTISASIPANLPVGCNYLFRIKASNPLVFGNPTSSFRIGNPTTPINNYALKFNGTNAKADLGTWFNQPSFTASFWVNPDSIQHSGAIADLQNDLSLYANPSINTNYILAHLMQQDLLPNKWQHVTITEDTGTRKLYLNGQLVQTNHWTYAPLAGHHLVLGNGGVYTSAYWKGQIDEVKVYNHVLTDAEILADVNKTLTGNESGLLAYWTFDDEVCSAVSIDKTSNARVGALTNVQRVPSTVPNLGQQVVPNVGGNTGIVTVNISGSFFKQGAGVKLSKAGSTDIIANAITVNSSGENIQCQLNLAGKDTGIYNVSVMNPDTTVKFYPHAFTVTTGTAPDVWVNITGSNVIRQQRDMTFLVTYGNNGNTDARGVPLWVAIDGDSTATLKMNFTEKGNANYNSTLAFDSIPQYYLTDSFAGVHGKFTVVPLYIPVIAPNTSGVLNFTIRANDNVHIQAIAGQPLYRDSLSQQMSTCIGRILASHAHDILNNLVPGDSCFVTAFDSLSQVPGYTGIGNLLYNMAAAVRLCAGPGVPANTLSNMAQQVYNVVLANGGEAPCLSVLMDKGVDVFVHIISSYDPNEKTGPAKYTQSKQPYTYSIHFENDATASAPAQEVVVIDTLDKTKYDLSTFSFGSIGWGDSIYSTTYPYQKTFSLDYNRVTQDSLVVRVQGYFDTISGVLRWKFMSLDPATLDLTANALRGFLPPNVTAPQGEGFVTFNVKLLPGITTPAQVDNRATIVFDFNPSIATNTYTNVVDDVKPHSQVVVPATTTDTIVQITWSGTDVGSGIKYYNVYVQRDTLPYEILELHTADVATTMVGRVGSTYHYFSIATDSAGNVQDDTIYARTSITTGIPELADESGYLKQNVPNPYSGTTTIEFYLPSTNTATLEVKDIYGRKIATLVNGQLSAGWHSQVFDSNSLAAGIYLYQLTVNGHTTTKRMVIE